MDLESQEVTIANPKEFGHQKREKMGENAPDDKVHPPKPASTTPTAITPQQLSNKTSNQFTNLPSDMPDPLEGIENDSDVGEGLRQSKRAVKPSGYVKCMLAGEAETTKLPVGMRVPDANDEEGKGISAVGAR